MRIVWSRSGWADVDRLHAFLAQHDLNAADAVLDRLIDAPATLLHFPRRGQRLSEFGSREVRELRVGSYLLRYELTEHQIIVLRFFHVRENRSGGEL